MVEPHIFEKNGIKYERIFCIPNTAVSTQLDPFSSKQFVEKTGTSKGNVGDLFSRSRDLSEQRASLSGGVDAIKEQSLDKWSKDRNGRCESSRKIKKIKNSLDKMGIIIE